MRGADTSCVRVGMATSGEELESPDQASQEEKSRPPSALNEPFVGNVSKYTPLPPDYIGREKKGHLQYDACFECGELAAPLSPTHLSYTPP